MDIRQWREDAGVTQAALATDMGIGQSQVSRYEDDPESIPYGLLKRWLARLGVDASRVEAVSDELSPSPVDVGRPWEAFEKSLDAIRTWARSAEAPLPTHPFETRHLPSVKDVEALLATYGRKPRLVLAGRSDAGKSRLANSLLGRPLLPTRYGPATRLITNVHHLTDRPAWLIGTEVLLVRRGCELHHLTDRATAEPFIRKAAGYDLLQSAALYEPVEQASNDSDELFVFADAPLLHAVALVDLPGSRGATGSEDADADRAAQAAQRADVLIYASPVVGFLDGLDLEFLARLIPALPPFERTDPAFPPLGNLFLVATHATPAIPLDTLEREVLAAGRTKLWNLLHQATLPSRARMTGVTINRNALESRFFGFWAERRELRDRLHAAVANCVGSQLPSAWRSQTHDELERFKAHAVATYRDEEQETRRALADGTRARAELMALQLSEKIAEPLRQMARRRGEEAIEELSRVAQESLTNAWQQHTTPAAIERLVTEAFVGPDARDQARQQAATWVLERIRKDILRDCSRAAASLPEEVRRAFEQSSTPVTAQLPGAEGTDGAGPLAALIGTGVAALAGLSGGLSLVIGGVAWSLFGETWKSRLAKSLSSDLQKRGLQAALAAAHRAFWAGQLEAFREQARTAEEKVQRDIKQREEVAKAAMEARPRLEAWAEWLAEQRVTFRQMSPPR